jgi:VIT1/CCC1 family predicted Fe2+/Mn2+ transporter
LRAAVLGANDGIVSTASLIIGVAAAGVSHPEVMLAGVAGLVAGAMPMAAGEYVSVSSQSDTEKADLRLEQHSLDKQYDLEILELTHIYESRGVSPSTSRAVLGVGLASLVFLALLGGIAARAGGASIVVGALRVTFLGALAMLLTAAVGKFFNSRSPLTL